MYCKKDSIVLDKILVDCNYITYNFTVNGDLKKYFNTTTLFIEFETNVEGLPESILTIPFVANFMPLVWLTDSVLWVKSIDKTFYESIYRIKMAYQEMYYNHKFNGTIIPAQILENTFAPMEGAIVLFSGGVDAHTTYIRHKNEQPILLNIQGWYKDNICEDKVYDADKRDISEFAKREGVISSFVRSNFATIINEKRFNKVFKLSWWHDFNHSMSFITIAMLFAFVKDIKTIYIASSFTIGDIGRCASFPTVDNEFKFATVGKTIHDAFELSRQDKVKLIVGHQKSVGKPYPIRVCSFNDVNCCQCEKCFRTILGINAEGGNIKDFGFSVNESLTSHWKNIMKNNITFFGVEQESTKHWGIIKSRIVSNYDNVNDKEFADWFMNYDFIGKRKKAVREYRIKNCMRIFRRKLKERLHWR